MGDKNKGRDKIFLGLALAAAVGWFMYANRGQPITPKANQKAARQANYGSDKDNATALEPASTTAPEHPPVWEVTASHDSNSFWRELRVQRQGRQEVINFRSVPKEGSGLFVYGVYLYGPEELQTFREILKRYHVLVEKRKTDPLNAGKQKLGQTSVHQFWFNFDAGEPVLEFSDPKNFSRGGLSMYGKETLEVFRELNGKYESLSGLLDTVQNSRAKP